MVRSVLYLQPRENDHAALADYYRRYDVLNTAVTAAGCLATELHVPLDGAGPALVTALWKDEAGYQGWLDHDLRGAGSEELLALLDLAEGEVPAGRLYTVALAAGGAGAVPVQVDDLEAEKTAAEG